MKIQEVRKKYEKKLLKKANVVGVMTAYKIKAIASDADTFGNKINFRFGSEYTYIPILRWGLRIAARIGYKTATISDLGALSGLSAVNQHEKEVITVVNSFLVYSAVVGFTGIVRIETLSR